MRADKEQLQNKKQLVLRARVSHSGTPRRGIGGLESLQGLVERLDKFKEEKSIRVC